MQSLFDARAARCGEAVAGSAHALIARSWQRSLREHGLDPQRDDGPRVLSAQDLREHLQPMQPLLELARSSLQQLFEQVRDAGYVVLMTDPEGVAVCLLHDPRFDRALRSAGLWCGSAWQERTEGTCAVALSVLDRVALTVHRDEHFRASNRGLTCSAAPVLGADGSVLGVIDVSALSSPDDKRSQQLVLGLVREAARVVEDAWFCERFSDQWVLRIGAEPRLLDLGTDALLAVDGHGAVLGANRRFLAQCAVPAAALCGQPLEQLLGVGLDALCARHARDPQAATALQLHVPQPPAHRDAYAVLRAPRRTRAAARQRDAAAPAPAPDLAQELAELAGADRATQASARRAQRLLGKGVHMLLQGESGTGKEAFARALHACSARADGPFVAVNCAAIPESLIESELFGYGPHAFTGASRHGVRGRIAQADGGTLFLDEIGDMPLPLQTRLLRVLGEHEVQSLGAQRPAALDAQVICASHRDLEQLVEEGSFRLDLLYRINGVTLTLPPLRARDDLGALIERVLAAEADALGMPPPPLQAPARQLLRAHGWPGNFRELRNVLRMLVVLGDGAAIDSDLVQAAIRPRPAATNVAASGFAPDFDTAPACAQAQALRRALQQCQGNVSEAARRLGIGRATMYRRMQRLGIAPPGRMVDPDAWS